MSGPLKTGPFPRLVLRDLEGAPWPVAEAWAGGEALLLIGHRDCPTTRQALPFVDRIHRGRGPGRSVVAVLQDDAPGARGLQEDLRLGLPLRLEAPPYPLTGELGVAVVPTLFLVGGDGRIERVSEAFNRVDLEALAERMGVGSPLFRPEDTGSIFRPG